MPPTDRSVVHPAAAIERDDKAIQRWVQHRWPALKKGQGARTR
jgi:hypothetical protein